MPDLYSIEIAVVATAYIKANSPEEALEVAKRFNDVGLHVGVSESVDPPVSARVFNDPKLPAVSLSPCMTMYGPQPGAWPEIQQENVPS